MWGRTAPCGPPSLESSLGIFLLLWPTAGKPRILCFCTRQGQGWPQAPAFFYQLDLKGAGWNSKGLEEARRAGLANLQVTEVASEAPQEPRAQKNAFSGHCCFNSQEKVSKGAYWAAQSVKSPTSAQVMISQFVSSSPRWALCSEPGACFGFWVSLSLRPAPHSHSVSLVLKNK